MDDLAEPSAIVFAVSHVELERVALRAEFLAKMLGITAVEVVTAEVVVAIDRKDLILPRNTAKNRNVERASAKVVDQKIAIAEATLPRVINRSRRRFLQNADD